MDIPTDIPRRINPEIQDPVSKSVVYTFSAKDGHFDKEGNLIYKFPYSKDTYWTNFKYTCYNTTKNEPELLEIGLELVTSDGYSYCIQMLHERQDKVWYDTEWPFPSIYTFGSQAGLYFKVTLPSGNSLYSINISLLGFEDLFPKVENYLLLSFLDTYQFEFSKFDSDDSKDSIFNVEHNDYIRHIIKKACGIRMIKRY
jgi:hypothetical protein